MLRIAALVLLLLTGPARAVELPAPLKESDFRSYPEAQARLGQLLFYDKVLSGTYRVSCATCHHHDRASSNGFRLDGKTEPERDTLAVENLPIYDPFKPSTRHAPALFNLGAKQFTRLFADGRVAQLADGRFSAPGDEDLPDGLRDVLAVQALFPAVTGDELVGERAGSELAAIAHKGNRAVWDALVARLRNLEGYPPLFIDAFDDIDEAGDISIAHVANAIGAFVGTEWRAGASPFDSYLNGDADALDDAQKRGMALFYGRGRCSTCHAGALQTDHAFYRAGMAGPVEPHEGRIAVTGLPQDRYRVRTPSLRNVAFTAPYGSTGAHRTLDAALIAHLSRRPEGGLPSDMPAIEPVSADERADLIAFLQSLTDEKGLAGRLGKPEDVPSFLKLD